ncbi:MAG: tetratricopeptide repeat protein [Myxococcota bacterium]
MPAKTLPLPSFLLLLVLACSAGTPGLPGARRGGTDVGDIPAAQLPQAARQLEQERSRNPRSVETRLALGVVYYRMAREALDRDRDEERYLEALARSLDELVTSVELDPENPEPHTYLAAIDLYQGDLPGTFRNLNNARRLYPSGVAYSNIAEAYVYKGLPDRARKWNDVALRKDAPYSAILYNDMLIAWREGDLGAAQRHFASLRRHHPEVIRRMHMAPLPVPPRSFEEFAAYCCESPACGPYLEPQCRALSLAVSETEISEEATLRALRLEMEQQRRIQEVYRQRKELELEVEP